MAYKQDTRVCTVKAPAGVAELLLERLQGVEHLSRPFSYALDLFSESATIDFGGLLGKPLSAHVELEDGSKRHFHGRVVRFTQGVTIQTVKKPLTAYRAEVVPWLSLLDFASDCRIYQDKSVPEIIKDVFNRRGFSDFEDKLTRSYGPWGYCVQYRESDFAFVSRLMEEEGIAYWFRHEEGKHVMVLSDSNSGWPVNAQSEAEFITTEGAKRLAGEVETWQRTRAVYTGKWEVDDWNFETPSTSLVSPVQSKDFTQLSRYDYAIGHEKLDHGDEAAKLRMEIEEAAAPPSEGSSTCPTFCAGTRFTLKGHTRGDCNDQYLLTSVRHVVAQGVGREGDDSGSYENSFSCIPAKIVFRPPMLTEKPAIHGIQTATVVGPSGEEIHVDKYGRVKLQFHWDRVGKRDEKSSCWVRSSQPIAGTGFGGIFLPRIGQEVVVSFVEGDPDRPLITGRVYNAGQMPPYELPGNMTQSGIMTRSTKGGSAENFNEIRFEDKKGEELFYVHAEKDREKMVEHDERADIGNDQTVFVHHDQKLTVDNNQTNLIKGQRKDDVEKDEIRSVGGDRTRNVGGKETINIGKNQDLIVDANRTLTIAENQESSVGKNLTVSVGSNHSEQVAKGYSLEAKTIAMEAADSITLETGSARIVMKKSGDITIEGKKISIKASGDIILKGSKIKEN